MCLHMYFSFRNMTRGRLADTQTEGHLSMLPMCAVLFNLFAAYCRCSVFGLEG